MSHTPYTPQGVRQLESIELKVARMDLTDAKTDLAESLANKPSLPVLYARHAAEKNALSERQANEREAAYKQSQQTHTLELKVFELQRKIKSLLKKAEVSKKEAHYAAVVERQRQIEAASELEWQDKKERAARKAELKAQDAAEDKRLDSLDK